MEVVNSEVVIYGKVTGSVVKPRKTSASCISLWFVCRRVAMSSKRRERSKLCQIRNSAHRARLRRAVGSPYGRRYNKPDEDGVIESADRRHQIAPGRVRPDVRLRHPLLRHRRGSPKLSRQPSGDCEVQWTGHVASSITGTGNLSYSVAGNDRQRPE